jgi:hypothetical protein
MKTIDFLTEAESQLDQMISQANQTPATGPGLIKQGISKVRSDLKAAPGKISDVIKRSSGVAPQSLASITAVGGQEEEPAAVDPQVQASVAKGEKVNVDPKVTEYLKSMANGKVAQQSTGTPEIDGILRSVGLMK